MGGCGCGGVQLILKSVAILPQFDYRRRRLLAARCDLGGSRGAAGLVASGMLPSYCNSDRVGSS